MNALSLSLFNLKSKKKKADFRSFTSHDLVDGVVWRPDWGFKILESLNLIQWISREVPGSNSILAALQLCCDTHYVQYTDYLYIHALRLKADDHL